MKPVVIVGAGFSGLTLAFSLRQLGLPVRVLERESRAGGMISTQFEEFGLVETAANALLADQQIEKLFADLELDFAAQLPARKRRFIFWHKPTRWPLSFFTSLRLIKMSLLNFIGASSVLPKLRETVAEWAERVVNAQFLERLLAPALQGVYAGDSQKLSAVLTLGSLITKSKNGRRRGSVAPKQGMGELIAKLTEKLKLLGVEIEFGQNFSLTGKPEQPTILCTSAWAAAAIVKDHDPALAEILERCESLPLVTATAFFTARKKDIRGFGCLFPAAEKFHSLGVLFNDCIFAGRSGHRSETWILGGALNRSAVRLSDAEVQKVILEDRARLTGMDEPPLSIFIKRWPRALPNYSCEWEESLRHLKVNRPLFLHGNYLGQLGLAKIHERSKALAAQIKDLYVS